MKCRKGAVILLIVALLSQVMAKEFYQLRENSSLTAKKSANHHRLFTEKHNYNSFNHAGLQSGKLDIERFPFTASLSGRLYSSDNDTIVCKNKNFLLPTFDLGTPYSKVFSGYYHLQPKSIQGDTLKIVDHHFGLAFATQTDDKTFRFGFDFGGAAGNESYKLESDAKRIYRSLDNFEIMMGSKPSDFVTLSIAGGADAVFDSLNFDDLSDRFFEITLPRITFATDLGDSTVPYRSSFAFTYGRKNFVYSTTNPGSMKTDDGDKELNADPVISDSTNWHWMNMWDIDVADDFQIHPAFDLGFMHNRHKRMHAGSKNHPFAYDGEADGYSWEEKSFVWGLGTSFRIVQFIDLFTEFSRNSLTLDLTGENMTDSVRDNDGYNRLMTGFSLGFHDIDGVDFSGNKLFLDFSFLLLNENGLYNQYYGKEHFDNIHKAQTLSQSFRYLPTLTYNNEFKTNRIAFGIRGIFKKGQVETDLNVAFLNQTASSLLNDDTEKSKGFELNFDIIYNVFTFAGR